MEKQPESPETLVPEGQRGEQQSFSWPVVIFTAFSVSH